jgi:polyisoprenoid-binding protein YceI/rhodanese-related sulfurtransferase
MASIDCDELKRWIDEDRPFTLLDVLPADAFEKARLPGARNACIYEVSFLDQVEEHVASRDADIVVYCSSPSSRASTDAAERLAQAGYGRVREFAGGREAWAEAGYPFEGTEARWAAGTATPPEDREYTVDPDESTVEWTGRNIGGRHHGTVRVASGRVTIRDGALAGGSFELDMDSLRAGDLTGEMADLLIAHLKSDDFFATAAHPVARFEITGVEVIDGATPGAPNCEVSGDLAMRGVTGGLSFPAVVATKDDALALDAHFDIDRTRWNVNYGSGKLYDDLGMHLVNDDVSLQVGLIAR